MNVTIFPTGTGSAQSAVNYLLSDVDHNINKRLVDPEILYGDPESFVAIANATSRKHKYTSGVIAFRDTETLSDRQIDEVIKSFRSTFLPGLEADKNYVDFWVAHREKGNLELHFLYANTELTNRSQPQLNIHPPGEKNIQFFNTFVSVTNDALGFAQVVPDPLKISLKPFEAKSPKGADTKKAKSDLSAKLHTNIINGKIKDRNQLIGFLTKNDVHVAMVTDDYITVKLPGSQKNQRLRGPLFEKNSDYKELVNQHHKSKIPKFLTPDESQAQQAKLAQFIKERSDFNHQRYLTPKPGARRSSKNYSLSKEVQSKAVPPDLKSINSKQESQLKKIRSNSEEKANSADVLAKQLITKILSDSKDKSFDVYSENPTSPGLNTSSLDQQIGSLSLQYHTLLIQLAGAKGQRAQKIRAQILTLEQKLAALNAELEKQKVNQNNIKNTI